MDIKALLSIFSDHPDKAIGTSLALIFLTGMALLVRSLGEKPESEQHGSVGSAIDVDVIEVAMKRVLATQPVSVVSGGAPLAIAAGDDEAVTKLNQAVQERESRIQILVRELEQARTNLNNAQGSSPGTGAGSGGSGSGGGGGGASSQELSSLKSKIDELQARLAEYEIIEDDIADLSLFKEENHRLKTEIEALKASGGAVAAPATTIATTAATAAAAAAQVAQVAPAPADTKSDKFELDINDDVMKEFAAAVEVQRAPPPQSLTSIPSGSVEEIVEVNTAQAAIDAMIAQSRAEVAAEAEDAGVPPAQAAIDALLKENGLASDDAPASAPDPVVSPEPAAASEASAEEESPFAGMMDTDKVLAEVASLDHSEVDGPALEDSLDTDKLLAEVGSFGAGGDDGSLEDDLLAEFKDK